MERASISIRFAGPGDAALIHRFIVELATYEREPHAVQATPASLAEQLASPRPPFECLIAELGGEPAGFALFFQSYSTWRGRPGMYLEDLFVRPERRGTGIGRRLLGRLAALCAERGYARLEWAVLDWNEPAIRFYRRLGAEPCAGWSVFRLTGDALDRLAGE